MIFDKMTSPIVAAKSLPFGMLLTQPFEHWDVDLSAEDPLPPATPLDHGF